MFPSKAVHAGDLLNTGQITNPGNLLIKYAANGLPDTVHGRVEFFGGNQSVEPVQYSSLILSGSGTKNVVGGQLAVTDSLRISPGITLQTGSGADVVLTSNGEIFEQGYLLGIIRKSVDLSGATSISDFGGIGTSVSWSGDAPGMTTIKRTSGIASSGNGFTSTERFVDITSAQTSGLNVTLVLHYSESELNGHSEHLLELWHSPDSGLTWRRQGGTVDTLLNIISKAGTCLAGRWTASDTNHPLGPADIDFTKDVSLGWNLLSLPDDPPDKYYVTLFPTATTGTLFGFNGSYYGTDSLAMTKGYWLRFPSATSETITGFPVPSITDTLALGWNLVGGPSCDVLVSAVSDPGAIVIPGTWFGFSGSYYSADTVKQGEGYWVRANTPGTISMSCGSTVRSAKVVVQLADLSKAPAFELSDGTGASQTLYADVTLPEGVSELSYSMPPVAPVGAFDARFPNDMRISRAADGVIQLQSSHYPVTVTLTNGATGTKYEVTGVTSYGDGQTWRLSSGASIQILDPAVRALRLHKSGGDVPTVFAMSQNYPNPFNPSTVIEYSVPHESPVTIEMYNLIGQKVRTLVDEVKAPGYYSITFNGSGFASGLYFYKMTAEKNSFLKKMMLLK